jgi:hypothetical protein
MKDITVPVKLFYLWVVVLVLDVVILVFDIIHAL